MKYVKLTMAALVLSLVTCGVSVFAADNVISYNAIDLKAFSGETQGGPATKKQTGAQSYRNFGTVDNCTAADKNVDVRVHYVKKDGSNDTVYSDWMTVSPGATSSWKLDAKTKNPDAYNIHIKVSTWGVCTAKHFGDWYLDRNI